MINLIFGGFTERMLEVFMALSPVILIFLFLQFFGLKLRKKDFKRIMIGFIITYIGLVFFLQGVTIAFIPIGQYLGETIAAMEHNFILIPLGFIMGFVVAFAEPAVRVLNNQVEELSSGSIKKSTMLMTISIGVAIAIALSMLKILIHASLWYFIVPGYIIVFVLARFVDPTFVAIAFDSGGVATGPMCSTFVLSFSLGVSKYIEGSNPMIDGLGMVALVALAPIISVMTLSFIYKSKIEIDLDVEGV